MNTMKTSIQALLVVFLTGCSPNMGSNGTPSGNEITNAIKDVFAKSGIPGSMPSDGKFVMDMNTISIEVVEKGDFVKEPKHQFGIRNYLPVKVQVKGTVNVVNSYNDEMIRSVNYSDSLQFCIHQDDFKKWVALRVGFGC